MIKSGVIYQKDRFKKAGQKYVFGNWNHFISALDPWFHVLSAGRVDPCPFGPSHYFHPVEFFKRQKGFLMDNGKLDLILRNLA